MRSGGFWALRRVDKEDGSALAKPLGLCPLRETRHQMAPPLYLKDKEASCRLEPEPNKALALKLLRKLSSGSI